MKIVINTQIGGAYLSESCIFYIRKISQNPEWKCSPYGFQDTLGDNLLYIEGEYRTDPHLIEAVEKYGSDINSEFFGLKVVEIPDDVDWFILEHDTGIEWVLDKNRVWQ